MQPNGLNRFLLVRDEFYSDPEGVRRSALSMAFEPVEGITGYMTTHVYHPPGIKRRLEQVLGIKITRWDDDPDQGNGIFYQAFSSGEQTFAFTQARIRQLERGLVEARTSISWRITAPLRLVARLFAFAR